MSLLAGGSILAAFFAGSVALFSPCCIVFLFPAYLASALKGRRWALFPLTLVFAAGLALVILPLTMGFGLLASALTRYHVPLYITGGLMMVTLGILAIAGRSWTMPGLRAPELRSDASGVFALGVFSGIASSCCAPGFQIGLGRFLTEVFGSVLTAAERIPEALLGVLLLAFACIVAWLGIRGARRSSMHRKESCHDHPIHDQAPDAEPEAAGATPRT